MFILIKTNVIISLKKMEQKDLIVIKPFDNRKANDLEIYLTAKEITLFCKSLIIAKY